MRLKLFPHLQKAFLDIDFNCNLYLFIRFVYIVLQWITVLVSTVDITVDNLR